MIKLRKSSTTKLKLPKDEDSKKSSIKSPHQLDKYIKPRKGLKTVRVKKEGKKSNAATIEEKHRQQQ